MWILDPRVPFPLSPVSNYRTDQYGGCFENHPRLAIELVNLTLQNVPDNFPVFFRITIFY